MRAFATGHKHVYAVHPGFSTLRPIAPTTSQQAAQGPAAGLKPFTNESIISTRMHCIVIWQGWKDDAPGSTCDLDVPDANDDSCCSLDVVTEVRRVSVYCEGPSAVMPGTWTNAPVLRSHTGNPSSMYGIRAVLFCVRTLTWCEIDSTLHDTIA